MTKDEFKKIRESFFNTIFLLLGHIANCDGYINRDELRRTKSYMEKMRLSPYCEQQAIRLFRQGSNPQFNMIKTLESFKDDAAKNSRISEVLLVYVISVATVDGLLVEKELKIIREMAAILGFSSIIFEHMLRMITAQDKIYRTTENTHSNKNTNDKNKTKFNDQRPMNPAELLESAYSALGISMAADKAEVKKVYRKLVNQYHPDKVQGQGLPPEFISAATEYFKRIHTAYEYIANH